MRSGSLFSGYGGLDMAIADVFGAEPAWFSEIDDAPSKILAHHWPDVPNLGDITQIDWGQVAPVDVLAGGFPCQDVSLAGKRAGMKPDTRSGLWTHMAYAIKQLRPRYVVAENVRGLLSADAHSDLEPCPWCLGDGDSEPPLRALGAVLADLADLGYDTQWCGLRAADVGAPHGRFRVFVLAADTNQFGLERRGATWRRRIGPPDHDLAAADALERPELRSVTQPAQRDIPDSDGSRLHGDRASERGLSTAQWGRYGTAIRRWELTAGRPAPLPTEPGRDGAHRLSARFVEWMMGLPAGHVSDVPDVKRSAQLKALGNGVVPQQAAAALTHMLNNLTLQASA